MMRSLKPPTCCPQPVVQRAESGPRRHGAGDPRDARRAGQPPERRGECRRKAPWEMELS